MCVCVCVCGWVSGWVDACVRACARALEPHIDLGQIRTQTKHQNTPTDFLIFLFFLKTAGKTCLREEMPYTQTMSAYGSTWSKLAKLRLIVVAMAKIYFSLALTIASCLCVDYRPHARFPPAPLSCRQKKGDINGNGIGRLLLLICCFYPKHTAPH